MSTTSAFATIEQLYSLPTGQRCELVRGEIVVMSPAGFRHGQIAARIARLLDEFVQTEQLGAVTGAETGFIIARDPDSVRAPDVAFVRRQRLPDISVTGYFDGPPDLAVEVLSPSDSASGMSDKVWQWLNSGTLSVWVIDPEKRTMESHRRSGDAADQIVTRSGDNLTDDLLPGFVLKAADVFAGMIGPSA